ncbi:MAG: enoyl-CoA hydratase-related protein [Pseudomonadota bacterium]
MSSKGHTVERRGPILTVRLTREHRANSLDPAACEALAETFDDFEQDDGLVVAIVTGAGARFFCAGLDLNFVVPGKRVTPPPSGFAGLTARRLNKPVIAAVNGAALGGGFELALACDMIIADAHASFGLPEPRVGQAALAGGLIRLPMAIGQKRAMDLILTGRAIDAQTALAWGLANEVTPQGTCFERAFEVASIISESAPLALQASKAVARTHERTAHLQEIAAKPPAIVEQMLDSEDAREGAAAFLEKRTPVWRGH